MLNPLRFCRRHPWLSISVLTLLGVGTAFCFFVLREGPINAGNFERITEGMTPAELNELLGEAQSTVIHVRAELDYWPMFLFDRDWVGATVKRYWIDWDDSPTGTEAYRKLCKDWADRKRGRTQRWQEGDRAIEVIFDTNDRAVFASFETIESPPSLWTRVKNWFQNLWKT